MDLADRLYVLDSSGCPVRTDCPLECYEATGSLVGCGWIPGWMRVVTFFLGLDHRLSSHEPKCDGCVDCCPAPILWESQIHRGDRAMTLIRYTSRYAAEDGHSKLLAWASVHTDLIVSERVRPSDVRDLLNG